MPITLAALVTGVAGASCHYLASPQQRLRKHPASRWLRAAGILLLAFAFWLWRPALGSGAALAAVMALCMTVWVALPYLAWWLRGGANR